MAREQTVLFAIAIKRFARSTLVVSISMWPSSRKRIRPRQRLRPWRIVSATVLLCDTTGELDL
jgi:hypothetical protein